MKIERLSKDKIRIFLTFDDLVERGIHKDDIWREIPKVHELFSEMMDQAYTELGFDATGPLAVEVFALPAQGMVVIVTRGKVELDRKDMLDEDEFDDEVYDLEVTLEQSDLISYGFSDFEHLLGAVHLIKPYVDENGKLFSYNDHWVLQIEPVYLDEHSFQTVVALLSEFGEANSLTTAVLEEYGKLVIHERAVQVLSDHFPANA